MKHLRRLIWHIASRLLIVTLVLGLLITGFYYAMNMTNIYVVLKDGMARRAQVVMMTEDRPLPGDRRLSFMARAIAKSGMTQEAVAKALGMRRTAIQHWLNEVDDCLVSQVYETAEVLGMKVKISIEPIQ